VFELLFAQAAWLVQVKCLVQCPHRQLHVLLVNHHRGLDFEVEIIWMLMPSSLSERNIRLATPTWLRMPMPTMETLQKQYVTVKQLRIANDFNILPTGASFSA
jgi:hypothetical protein